MKKIIISTVLAILSLMVGIFSFLTNDLTSYNRWMMDNGPRIMEKFSDHHKDKDRRDFRKDNFRRDDHHRDDRRDDRDRDHRGLMMDRPMDRDDRPMDRSTTNNDSQKDTPSENTNQ